MSNAKTGLAAAFGAVLGGVAGAASGYYAAQYRPRLRYARAARVHDGRRGAQEIEDAMVIGGGIGATVGAFIGGTLAGEDEPKTLTVGTR